jgi:hypothetical protein
MCAKRGQNAPKNALFFLLLPFYGDFQGGFHGYYVYLQQDFLANW